MNRRHEEDVHRSRISGEYQCLTLIKTSLALALRTQPRTKQRSQIAKLMKRLCLFKI